MNTLKLIQKYVGESNLELAISKLVDFLSSVPELKDAILIESRYNSIEKEKRRGVISHGEYQLHRNRISEGILDFIGEIEKNQNQAFRIYQGQVEENERFESPAVQSMIEDIKKESEIIQTQKAMKEIKEALIEYIPEFKELSIDLKNQLFREIRDKNIFHIDSRRVFLFGRTNAGKTTTINSLLEEPLFPASAKLSLTKSISSVEHKGGLIFYDSPGIGDERHPENITRASLKIPLIRDEINEVILIDATKEKNEGPKEYDLLNANEIKDEVNITDNSFDFRVKQFNPVSFGKWADKKIDFYVFVLAIGSSHGLDRPQLDFLEDFYKEKGKEIKLFKVFNIWNDGKQSRYNKNVNSLDEDIQISIRQAKERIKKSALPDPDKWYIIESNFSNGFEELIKGFADSLPTDVLMRIEKTVKAKYQHIIQEKIDEFFKSYLARVASVVGVYPVDINVDGQNLLSYSVKSLFAVADYLYYHNRTIDADLIDDMIEKLKKIKYVKKKKKKLRSYNKRTTKTYYVGSGNALIDNLRTMNNLPNYINLPSSERMYYYDKKKKIYYRIGGVDAVNFALSVGLNIIGYYKTNRKVSDSEFLESISKKVQELKGKTKHLYIPEDLRKFKNRNKRKKESDNLFPKIKKIIE